MINTKCPDCSARYYVSEDLVADKVVRFRCRKCRGTITVDGTGADGAPTGGPSEGPDAGLLSRFPPAPDAVRIPRPAAPDDKPAAAAMPASVALPPTRAPDTSADDVGADAGARRAIAPAAPARSGRQADSEGEATMVVQKGPKGGTSRAQDGEPTTLRKMPGPYSTTPTGASAVRSSSSEPPPSGKARLSRVSMALGAVFDVPPSDDIDIDLDDAPAFEEDLAKHGRAVARGVAPESVRLSEILEAKAESQRFSEVELEPESIYPAPQRKAPPSPALKAPPPPQRVGSIPRVKAVSRESAPIDLDAALRSAPRLPSSSDMDEQASAVVSSRSAELFAPVAVPSGPLSERAGEQARRSRPPKELAAEASGAGQKWGVWAAVGVAVLLIGGGAYALRGWGSSEPSEGATAVAEEAPEPVPPIPATTAAPKPEEPATPPPAEEKKTAEPAAVETKPKAEQPAAKPASTTTAAESKPVKTSAPETEPASPPPAPRPPVDTPAEPKPATTPEPPPPPKPPESSDAPFNRSAAAASIGGLKGAAQGCKQEGGPQGHASIAITFAPTGRVTTAQINGPPFAGTSVGGCIASTFRRASVPAFSGAPVTVRTSVAIF